MVSLGASTFQRQTNFSLRMDVSPSTGIPSCTCNTHGSPVAISNSGPSLEPLNPSR
eukprot:m.382339 g.382339  ORF g.382339 m.382339 type:complete len:56 (-) comp16718_c0_seq66:510-677(-)